MLFSCEDLLPRMLSPLTFLLPFPDAAGPGRRGRKLPARFY